MVENVAKIAEAFSISIGDILKLDPIPYSSFYEHNLTLSLKESIELLITKNKKVSFTETIGAKPTATSALTKSRESPLMSKPNT